MSRLVFKTVNNPLVEFIPKSNAEDSTLSKDAPSIKDRPLIFMVRKITREQSLNLRSILDIKTSKVNPTKAELENFGTVAKFIWDNCVIQVKNVLLDVDGEVKELEVVEGRDKNALFEVRGIDVEIDECLTFIQSISNFTDEEAKN